MNGMKVDFIIFDDDIGKAMENKHNLEVGDKVRITDPGVYGQERQDGSRPQLHCTKQDVEEGDICTISWINGDKGFEVAESKWFYYWDQVVPADANPSLREQALEAAQDMDAPAAVEITKQIFDVYEILLEKNRKYGNSALEPVRTFSKASASEQIKVRLDDKISRLSSGQDDEDEDVTLDLIGYLVLLRIVNEKEE